MVGHIGDEVLLLISQACDQYKNLDDALTSKKLSSEKWTLKEIVGHLIDSASNNHQRFVRLQIESRLNFPGYGKDNTKWLEIQEYNTMEFVELLKLWKQFNILICHIIQKVNPDALSHTWVINNTEMTLEALIVDYLRHLKDHLIHFNERLNEVRDG